jgi:ribosome-associated protein
MAGTRDLHLGRRRVLPARLVSARFVQSGGPGGQNVNKVATKADVRLDLDGAAAVLGEELVERIRRKLATRLDGDGNLQVQSSEHRTQARNLEGALARMENLLKEALAVPRKRRPTRPSRAARKRRLDTKRRRGDIKRMRRERFDP